MIARYKIPDVFLPGFKALASLSEEDSMKIAEVLKQSEVGGSRLEFKNNLSKALNQKEAENIADSVFSTGALLAAESSDTSSLPTVLTRSIQTQVPEMTDAEAEKFENNISIILQKSDNLKLTFKAYGLLAENFNSLISSRIVTDFRPIFDDATINAKFGLVVHSLKLGYQHANENEEFFVSMTSDELRELQNQIMRALEKEVFIKDNLKNFQFVTIKEDR